MELKTKYQYTSFIHPYVIDERKYDKYILKLVKNKRCKLKIFEREKDINIYKYFLPKARELLFWSFGLDRNKIKKLQEMDYDTKAIILSKYNCVTFEYILEKNIQGKLGENNGIFFDLNKVEIICFSTGVCFIILKAIIENSNDFQDILDFNYKFKDINSEIYKMNKYENIRIQSDKFNNSEDITKFIKDITGKSTGSKEFNIDNQSFLVYAYTCIDGEYWKSEHDFEKYSNEFYKYTNIKPSTYNIDFSKEYERNNGIISSWNYTKFGISKMGSVLITSGIQADNYTKLPYEYENEYLYTYILILYKKLMLKKINALFSKVQNFRNVKNQFIQFTQKVWIQDVTDDELGNKLMDMWSRTLRIDDIYAKAKNKYDIMYKDYNIEKTRKTNKWIMVLLILSLILNIINFSKLLG